MNIFNGIPNVHVIRDGPIDSWVKNAFAILHNGCTTALEASCYLLQALNHSIASYV